jgi:hypothetical protein
MGHAYKNDYFLIKSVIYFKYCNFCSAKFILVSYSFHSPETAVILINIITEETGIFLKRRILKLLRKWMCHSVVGCIFSSAYIHGIRTLNIQSAGSPKRWRLSNKVHLVRS